MTIITTAINHCTTTDGEFSIFSHQFISLIFLIISMPKRMGTPMVLLATSSIQKKDASVPPPVAKGSTQSVFNPKAVWAPMPTFMAVWEALIPMV